MNSGADKRLKTAASADGVMNAVSAGMDIFHIFADPK